MVTGKSLAQHLGFPMVLMHLTLYDRIPRWQWRKRRAKREEIEDLAKSLGLPSPWKEKNGEEGK